VKQKFKWNFFGNQHVTSVLFCAKSQIFVNSALPSKKTTKEQQQQQQQQQQHMAPI